jgi:hypothetical protein
MTKFAFKKKLLSSAMVVAMASGIAISNNANAIHVSEDNIGQVLLAPYYTVKDGNTTKFKIVNTRSDVAVKAKVVFRSMAQSTEVLDFICYLSPNDVCVFEVVDIGGQAYLQSNDDSLKNGNTFASVAPVSVKLYDERMKARDANDINEIGHVEVIGAYAASGSIDGVAIKPGISKFDLLKIFNSPRPGADGVASIRGYTTFSADPNLVRLTGSVEVVKAGNSDRMGYTIPALVGSVGDNVVAGLVNPRSFAGGVITGIPFDGRVIACPVYDTSVVQVSESAIGLGFAADCGDNTFEIEHALATRTVIGTYEDGVNKNAGPNGTSVLVTFPTKYRHRMTHVCTAAQPTPAEVANAYYTPPFNPTGTVNISLAGFDNQENSIKSADPDFSGAPETPTDRLFAEVNMYTPSWPYESGAYYLGLNGLAGCSYAGVPALAMTYKWMRIDGQTKNSMLNPAAVQ